MKAILVIDMPDGVEAEDYYMAYGLFTHKGEKPFRVAEIAFQCEEVDLRPLPKKEIVLERKINGVTANYLEMAEARIRNRIIDEILGDAE